jgi:hypothetical protein
MGTDKFMTVKRDSTGGADKHRKGEVRLHLSPFYQHANMARNGNGTSVPLGDRLGRWNMLALFFGEGAIFPKTIAANYTKLNSAKNKLSTFSTTGTAGTVQPPFNIQGVDTGGAGTPGYRDCTLEANYNPDTDFDIGSYAVDKAKFEKLGIRGQITIELGSGFGISLKGGANDYKMGSQITTTAVSYPLNNYLTSKEQFYKDLMNSQVRNDIFKEIGLDANPVHKSSIEDFIMQAYWHGPIDLRDSHGDVAVTIIPYIAAGALLPVGNERDYDKIYAVPSGNDGFAGLVFDAALNFDFPGTVQVGVGAGLLASNTRDIKNVRVPSSQYQSGIYPWKTDIKKQLGVTWYANASLKAEDFIKDLAFYLDYVYTCHESDDVTLKETDATRKAAFNNGLDKFKRETAWKNQQFDVGLNYKVTPRLAFGAAVQSHISGVNVFKTTTVMGSMTLMF